MKALKDRLNTRVN